MYTKDEIRRINKDLRSRLNSDEVREKSKSASEHFLNSEFYKNSNVLMLYMPLGKETDTTDIFSKALLDGKKTIFPVTDPETGVITPCYADSEDGFTKGAFSVSEPSGEFVSDVSVIDVVLVPGIAYDRNGARVGFGKGCYDRLLSRTKAFKIGFCYEFQIVDSISSDSHDIAVDYIVTENGIWDVKQSCYFM